MLSLFRLILAGVALLWAAPAVLCAENAPLVPATPAPTLVNCPHPITPSASSVDSADTLRWHIPDLTPLRLKSSANTSVLSAGLITRDRHLSGLQLNLLGGDVERRLRGAQISGFLSVVRGEAEGVQLAPLYNYASRIRGAQIASMFNITEQAARGWQAAAATNLAVEGDGIVQTALTNVVLGRMRGVQLGATNYAGQFRGVQIGVVNVAMGTSNGLQQGLLNFTRDTSTVKVVWSISPRPPACNSCFSAATSPNRTSPCGFSTTTSTRYSVSASTIADWTTVFQAHSTIVPAIASMWLDALPSPAT